MASERTDTHANAHAICMKCKQHERRIRQLEAENERLLRAVHRESDQWDTRAPNRGR